MLYIITLRHGITEWNVQKRIQGRTDIALSEEGISVLKQYSLPVSWHDYPWFCSPLLRTRQTADWLALTYQTEPALTEMNWGVWEGHTITGLRQHHPAFSELEQRGLDLCPPEGESPRMVRQRVTQWVQHYYATAVSHENSPVTIGMVTHKGVIRAMLAAATGWDMKDKPPVKLNYKAAQCFSWNPKQGWALPTVNIPLLPEK